MSDYDLISPGPDEYRKLVTPQILNFPGSVFYEPGFLVTLADIQNLEFAPIIALKGNRIVGLANLLIRRRAGIKSSSIPTLIQYYGPVNLTDEIDVTGLIIEKLAMDKIDLSIFSLPPEYGHEFNYSGWRKSERLTYFLKPNTFESMFSCSTSSCKNKINKAIRNNIEVAESKSVPIDIYSKTFTRRNMMPPISLDTLTKWSDRLNELGLLKTFIARHNSISIAFRSIFYYGRYAYNWVSGALPEAFKYGAGNLLMVKVCEYLFKKGIIHYDLVGGDIKSIAEFKKSFGSIPKKHIQVERSFTLKGKIYRGLMKMKARLNG